MLFVKVTLWRYQTLEIYATGGLEEMQTYEQTYWLLRSTHFNVHTK